MSPNPPRGCITHGRHAERPWQGWSGGGGGVRAQSGSAYHCGVAMATILGAWVGSRHVTVWVCRPSRRECWCRILSRNKPSSSFLTPQSVVVVLPVAWGSARSGGVLVVRCTTRSWSWGLPTWYLGTTGFSRLAVLNWLLDSVGSSLIVWHKVTHNSYLQAYDLRTGKYSFIWNKIINFETYILYKFHNLVTFGISS